MRAFAEWVSSRRYRSVAIAGLFGLLSPLHALLAPLAVPSAGIVVLANLRHGVRESFLVLASATVLLILAYAMLGGGSAVVIALAVGVGLWLPALGIGELLRRSNSLSLCLQAAALGISALAVALFVIGDPVSQTRTLLEAMKGQLEEALQGPFSEETLTTFARGFTALAFAGTLITLAASVLLGRWWESLLRGGGFAEEFRQLRMGRLLALAFAVVMGAYLLTHAVVLESVICILGVGFMLQGLAVLHTAAAVQGMNVGWLVALYAALFATAFAGIVIALVGWLDVWLDLRGRLQRKPQAR
jgi:hypothetical protein